MTRLLTFLAATLAISVGPAAAQFYDSYPEYDPRFMGYPCTIDCSGHEAGYEWAYEKGINDPDDCGGYSQSFIEGCYAAAEEQYEDEYGYEYDW